MCSRLRLKGALVLILLSQFIIKKSIPFCYILRGKFKFRFSTSVVRNTCHFPYAEPERTLGARAPAEREQNIFRA